MMNQKIGENIFQMILLYLHDPSYMLDITKTDYKIEDLPKMCEYNYTREPFIRYPKHYKLFSF